MTNADLGEWSKSGQELQTQNAGTKATYTIPQVVDLLISIVGLDIENVGQYKGCVYKIQVNPSA